MAWHSCSLFCRLSAERYPVLGEYYALLKDRPSIKASWPSEWLENTKGEDTLKDIWDSTHTRGVGCMNKLLFQIPASWPFFLSLPAYRFFPLSLPPVSQVCGCRKWGKTGQMLKLRVINCLTLACLIRVPSAGYFWEIQVFARHPCSHSAGFTVTVKNGQVV